MKDSPMKVSIEDGQLVIRTPANLTTPRLSGSGKSLLVVSDTKLNATTVLNRPLKVSVNAYIPASPAR